MLLSHAPRAPYAFSSRDTTELLLRAVCGRNAVRGDEYHMGHVCLTSWPDRSGTLGGLRRLGAGATSLSSHITSGPLPVVSLPWLLRASSQPSSLRALGPLTCGQRLQE